MIKTLDLSGNWEFALDKDKTGIADQLFTKPFTDTILLPGTTSMSKKGTYSDKKETGSLTDPYLFEGYAWYSKEITLAPEDLDKPIFLHLERTRMTQVWIDDKKVGAQDSLNTPHIYNLGDYITSPNFRLTILVSNVDYPTKGGHLTSPDTQTNWNGIIGDISIRIYNSIYIESAKTYGDIEKKQVTVKLTTQNHTVGTQVLPVTLKAIQMDINGDTGITCKEATYDVTFAPGTGEATLTYTLGDDAVLWSEHSPVIYRLEISAGDTGEKISTTFGLRKMSTTETEFLINGTPTFLRGKHDGLIFPLTAAVPATVEEWIKVMKTSKSYGINHYRFHTCCPPDAAFVAADLLGIYMEPQLPFWGTITTPEDENHNEEEQQYLIKEGFRMMDTFGNHASYCLMSLGNELWGSQERLSKILADYKAVDTRHLYTQGSNNFQHAPVILPEEDFYVGVRLEAFGRHFRGSYGMCDTPLGHVQTQEPSTTMNYDEIIHPTKIENAGESVQEEIEIQYGTGVKKVKAEKGDNVLIPHIPVVSHEIGQYAVYPNFREIEKYTGVLKARNFEVFRDHLEKRGMLDQADDFFYASGKLSVQCYKEELEAAARSSLIAGYQLLDIQDFSGQGTALVGILDAFMDSKGHVTPEEWRGYCSDGILLGEFEKYIWSSEETFEADVAIRYYNPEKLVGKQLHWEINNSEKILCSGDIAIPDNTFGLHTLGKISTKLPPVTEPENLTLTLRVEGTSMKNYYELYLYPSIEDYLDLSNVLTVGSGQNVVCITSRFEEAKELLAKGKRVLYLPQEVAQSLEGFYCTDFWCYPMFRDICEWMKKPVAVGTMGLLIQNEHPALEEFPSHKYSTPQWYQIVTNSDCAILDDATDKAYRPIVQMIDNFERNHKLGILFEGAVGEGSLMICTCRFSNCGDRPEVRQFVRSLLSYLTSDEFQPKQTLNMDKLEPVFIKE